jgi:DNA invertase Pin-like site-specific DNA recombinase
LFVVFQTSLDAAEYLRTSTRLQPFSLDAQRRVIREYADYNGFTIVRTYVDDGRSGLTLRGRAGLSALLSDIAYGRCQYRAVLVHDVSRWGRFQDGDEAAHYEFLCKSFGVPVHYCAESFANDEKLPTFILKSLKRMMAAEYSRELSIKCFRGQKHLSEKGFRTGGTAGYGLCRMAISEDGSRTQVLRPGELKSISSDRVILIPGPDEEIKAVLKIFSMATTTNSGYGAIASKLNAGGVPYKPGRAWADYAVEAILKNKKYAGWHVWNRTTGRLATNRQHNPEKEWIVVPNAFKPIVSPSMYDKAQKLRPKGNRWTKEQLLQRVEQLRTRSPENNGPCPTTLRRRLIGMSYLRSARGTTLPHRADGPLTTRQRLAELRNDVLDTLAGLYREAISEFHLSRKSRPLLKLANGRTVSVIVCARVRRETGMMRWMFRPILAEAKFITLICLEFSNRMGYYLVPRVPILRASFIGTGHFIFRTGIRLNDLAEFYDATGAFGCLSSCVL